MESELTIPAREHPLQLRVVVQPDGELRVELGAASGTLCVGAFEELAGFLRDAAAPCNECIRLESQVEAMSSEAIESDIALDAMRRECEELENIKLFRDAYCTALADLVQFMRQPCYALTPEMQIAVDAAQGVLDGA